MYSNEHTSEVVNELMVVNNDRYQGYKKAAEETKDESLRSMFMKLGEQSLKFKRELEGYIAGTDHTDAAHDTDETKASGKLYRVWMDVKAALSGNDRKTILASCEHGEDVALENYNDALDNTEGLQSDALMTIQRQRAELKQSHDMIKSMRDSSGTGNTTATNMNSTNTAMNSTNNATGAYSAGNAAMPGSDTTAQGGNYTQRTGHTPDENITRNSGGLRGSDLSSDNIDNR